MEKNLVWVPVQDAGKVRRNQRGQQDGRGRAILDDQQQEGPCQSKLLGARGSTPRVGLLSKDKVHEFPRGQMDAGVQNRSPERPKNHCPQV